MIHAYVRACLRSMRRSLIELSSRSPSTTPYCLHASGGEAEAEAEGGTYARSTYARTYVQLQESYSRGFDVNIYGDNVATLSLIRTRIRCMHG